MWVDHGKVFPATEATTLKGRTHARLVVPLKLLLSCPLSNFAKGSHNFWLTELDSLNIFLAGNEQDSDLIPLSIAHTVYTFSHLEVNYFTFSNALEVSGQRTFIFKKSHSVWLTDMHNGHCMIYQFPACPASKLLMCFVFGFIDKVVLSWEKVE